MDLSMTHTTGIKPWSQWSKDGVSNTWPMGRNQPAKGSNLAHGILLKYFNLAVPHYCFLITMSCYSWFVGYAQYNSRPKLQLLAKDVHYGSYIIEYTPLDATYATAYVKHVTVKTEKFTHWVDDVLGFPRKMDQILFLH